MNGIIGNSDKIITPEKAATVAKLEAMRSNDWEELRAMTDAELSELHDEIDAAAVVLADGDPHNAARDAAYRAIRDERIKRKQASFMQWQEQQTRENSIRQAASQIRDAIRLVDVAHDIPDLSGKPPAPPSLDVESASDGELRAVCGECRRIVNDSPSCAGDDARAIALIRSDAAKAICKELQARARADADRREEAHRLLTAIESEQARREGERAAEAAAMEPQSLLARIEALESQLAEKGASDDD